MLQNIYTRNSSFICLQKVNIVVYINGETSDDVLWYSRYCSWKEEGMPFSTYAPVTIKVGGDVVSKFQH